MKWLVLLLAGTGCAPTLVWSGRDVNRQVKAEVLGADAQQWLRVGEQDGARFDAIGLEGIVFSATGAVAYPAIREGKWYVVTPEQTLGPYSGVAELQFNADGTRLAFASQAKDGWRVVVDGVAGPPFEDLQPRTLQFSRGGAHVAYVGLTGKCATIVVDGEARPCLERVLALRVTDAGTVAAAVREGGKARFLFGATLGPAFEAIGGWVVTEDGAHHAYAGRQADQKWVPVIDAVAWSACARVSHLRFGDQGKKVAWVCANEGKAALVVDGTAGPVYPTLSAPVLAEDGPDVAVVARDPNGAWVIAGDASWGPFAEVSDLIVQRTGIAFVARSNGLTRVVHGQTQTPLPAVVEGSLVLSPAGDHWAAIAGDVAARELWIAIDGKKLRSVPPEDVFGEPPAALQAWLARELVEATR